MLTAPENTTTNGTQLLDCSFNPFTTGAKIGQTFAYCLIFVVSLAGNVSIGIIFYKVKTMRKPINVLILNMAMSDLLFPIFLIPERLTSLYAESWLISGPLGQALCTLVPFLKDVSLAVSTQSLVLIAVDRFEAAVFPLRSRLISSKLCPFFVFATWIVATATFFPWFFASKLVEYPGRLECKTQWSEAFGESSSYEHYVLAICIVIILTPLILISILYTIIYVKLKSQTVPGERSANGRPQRVKMERHVLRMSIAIVLGFAVCWLPISIGTILSVFVSKIRWSCGFQYFFYITYFVAIANCAINPCICFAFSGNYRQAIKNIL